ncbi:MAG: DUF3179 domain-containing protein [Gemmatimonadales bacterium]|nr:MAG: DUF3179 domain-containing protein [Gemmatimonadales bacterium]
MRPQQRLLLPALLLLFFLPACSDSSTGSRSGERLFADLTCSIPENDILDGGVGIDGIPSVQNPPLVLANAPGAAYLEPSDRIIGLVLDGQPVAIPHNILWWHEIANLDLDSGERLAVTYCPLTGTSMVFDRAPVDGAELGVSGLLFRSNLIMFDRQSGQSLWPQMLRGARCGPADGTELPMVASLEMTWQGWQALHPSTQVVSSELGFARNYRLYPYGDYERATNAQTLVPLGGLDERRPPKERILGIPTLGGGGIAFPFFELNALGMRGVVHPESAPDQVVVFWDREVEGAMAYRPTLDGESLVFHVVDGRILDQASGSQWRIDGVAVEGPLAGRALEPIDEAYVAFWFAWADFHPETELWLP